MLQVGQGPHLDFLFQLLQSRHIILGIFHQGSEVKLPRIDGGEGSHNVASLFFVLLGLHVRPLVSSSCACMHVQAAGHAMLTKGLPSPPYRKGLAGQTL